MRWQTRPVLALLVFILCIFGLFSSDRFSSTSQVAEKPPLPPLKANFAKLSESSYAYFAVDDRRNGNMGFPFIRILVLARKNMRFHCKFASGAEVSAKLYEFSENHQMPFGVYYANCKIPDGEVPSGTIEVSDEVATTWVSVPITYQIQDERTPITYEIDYSICVPVLYGDKYTPARLVEFMELNALLGSQRVTIYTDVKNLTQNLRKVINFYSESGMLQVIDFVLPMQPSTIWYYGQLAVVTDCLMRQTGVARFTAFHDIDEFLVPMLETNVATELHQSLTGNIGSLRVPTQYMMSAQMNKAPLITMEAFTHSGLERTFTKCVLRPEMVFEQGIHHTSRVIQDQYTSPAADDKRLRLFHYKNRGGASRDTRLMDVYGSQLQQNVDLILKYLGV